VRMSSCKARKRSFVIEIDPENKPINPSPWYAFRVTPKTDEEIKIIMRYSDAAHRYRPKTSTDGKAWALVTEDRVKERRKGKKVVFKLAGAKEAYIVAAQEIILDKDYRVWRAKIAAETEIELEEIGQSIEGRSLVALKSHPKNDEDLHEHVLFVGRQHPPEVTGALSMFQFLETVFGDSDLAKNFRERFHIFAVPILNPDGVANGHWRHNMNGVDLNRDWGPFKQPETQSIKKYLDEIDAAENSKLMLMFDFHSTRRNVFYTQASDETTDPDQFTEKWLEGAKERLDGKDFERAERPANDMTTSKQYIFRRFGAPAVT